MCKYCKNESGYVKTLDDVAYGLFADIGFYGDTREVCVSTEAFGKKFTCNFKINYCPMCGRKLTESEEQK